MRSPSWIARKLPASPGWSRSWRGCAIRRRGCEWDKVQTFETIAPYTIEEAYEVDDAIRRGDMAALKDELGDLQLQVVYHARMAEERGAFTLDDVMASICAKMDTPPSAHLRRRRRQPRLGGAQGGRARGADRIASALAGVALALPALKRAEKIQRRAARVGFDWPDVAGPAAEDRRGAGRDRARRDRRGARRPRSATCCSPSSIMPATSASTPKPRCAKPRRASKRASARWKRWPTSHLKDMNIDELEALWQRAKKLV